MASKKSGRLAGLAALAGLAYMATKDKDKAKAGGKPNAEKTQTYAETAEDEDAEMGRLTRANQMRARGEAEGKKVDGSDRFAGPATTKDTEFGDLEGAMKRNAETKTTPAKVARSKPREVTTGDFARSDRKVPASKPYVPPATAKPYVPFSRSPSIAPSGKNINRDVASEAEQSKLMRSYVPDTRYKLRDTRFTEDNDPNPALYDNEGLRQRGAEERPESEERKIFGKKRGGVVKKMASGGMTSSASKRGDGIAQRGKTKGRVC